MFGSLLRVGWVQMIWSRARQEFRHRSVEVWITCSPIGCRELVESSPYGYWEFVGNSPKEIGSSLGVHRKDAGSSPGVC
ncbi:hypothetical protein BHE74_00022755 [Ensete ventricosum]|nr:hypothetical protein GW17_00041882 [Ensete ventricosum]RWW69634.1 hypothetical protein BHE74_00022755 [Ensete ventricosum]